MRRHRPVILPLFIPFAGCRHRCLYCEQALITGARPGVDSVETGRRLGELVKARRRDLDRPAEVAFYGGSFSALPREEQASLLEVAAPWRQSGEIGGIRVSTRPDAVDEEGLDFLASRGVTCVELGVPSLDDRVLELAGRGHTADDARRAARLVKGRGLALGLQMMTGLPRDTPAATLATARGLADLAPDFVRIYPTLVIEGTALAGLWRRGAYRPWDLEETLEALACLIPLFDGRGIPLARVGLLVEREVLDRGGLLAGPWHPALGDLARRRIGRRKPDES